MLAATVTDRTQEARPRPLPLEQAGTDIGWWKRCGRTLLALLAHPHACFRRCPEPVDHGKAVRFLATLRLPPWILLVALLGMRHLASVEPEPISLIPIHRYVEPPLAHVISVWLVLMVPVGIPLLYFFGGLIAHVGVALTGGAPRSIGATMRAVGYALAPALLAIGILDLPLHLEQLRGQTYVAALWAVTGFFLWSAGVAIARTHQVSLARGFLVGVLPALGLFITTLGRASLVLPDVPGLPPVSDSPYYIP
jgi:hypothetical protein